MWFRREPNVDGVLNEMGRSRDEIVLILQHVPDGPLQLESYHRHHYTPGELHDKQLRNCKSTLKLRGGNK